MAERVPACCRRYPARFLNAPNINVLRHHRPHLSCCYTQSASEAISPTLNAQESCPIGERSQAFGNLDLFGEIEGIGRYEAAAAEATPVTFIHNPPSIHQPA
jgi:hypothetical protein